MQLRFDRGQNDCLYTEQGGKYIDLIAGFGSVILGHCHPQINSLMVEQLAKLTHSGRFPTPVLDSAYAHLADLVPPSHRTLQLYTGGSEASEFALRAASCLTGKSKFLGFQNSMHGKSVATAQLGWANVRMDNGICKRIPFLPDCPEESSLELVSQALKSDQFAGVFVEPILGSSGGHRASINFYRSLRKLCDSHGVFFIVDEILTGFRAGNPFVLGDYGIESDILLFGKAIGNGFPVSCVAMREDYSITAEMLPGSTYSGNPLAAASVVATIKSMNYLDLPALVNQVERTVKGVLSDLEPMGFKLRGQGALWALEIPVQYSAQDFVEKLVKENVLVTATRSHVRLLPAATITHQHLLQACEKIHALCSECHSKL
ncbi:MAG: aminotransferase class III-fold pyridoxal phosphate-dependent enzyme [Gammaproteobacteria bacterium]|nr:aminotransferase class III-fold pyridoxal phosphate-dependent enzyme [Pseudomonadales bacterium]